MKEWVEAVDEDGSFGRWTCAVSFSPSDLPDRVSGNLGG
jgi:hypothetical protein